MMALLLILFAGLFVASSAVYQGTMPLSAHLEGGVSRAVDFAPNEIIKSWNPGDPRSHMSDGFVFDARSGKLRVPTTGRYYVYAQMYFNKGAGNHNPNRVYIKAANRVILMIHTDQGSREETTAFTGGVFELEEGDEIYLMNIGYNIKMWVGPMHSFFGLYLI